MRNKIRELEQKPLFKTIAYIVLVLLIGIIVLQVAFPNVKFRAHLKVDKSYCVLNEEYDIYTNMGMNEDLKKLYNTYLTKEIEKLPLYENDYVIIITDEVLTTANPYTLKFKDDGYVIAANTNKLRKSIIINKSHITTSFVHEVGHAVDNQYKFSETAEFEILYNQVEHNDYLNSDIGEYFAESYARFLDKNMNDDEMDLIAYYENILGVQY